MSQEIPAPTKIFGVHTNYESRTRQRGRVPRFPSYFLKPVSSLSRDGVPVVRPRGCELLTFEGEIAIAIGKRGRNLSVEDAAAHIGWVGASNDFGVYDMRHADRGSNIMAKGQDGYTPVGELVPAGEVDLGNLAIRTLVNGEVAQDDSTRGLLFSFALLVADLSRFLTLEPGDLILTGTPAGSRPAEPGDVVTVEVGDFSRVSNPIVESEHELEPIGAMPLVSAGLRAEAFGRPAYRPVEVPPETLDRLRRVSVATLTAQLGRNGIRDTFIRGLRPTRPDLRMVGYAFTLRWVAAREDLTEPKENVQRQAVETVSHGDVLVMEARGELGAATLGDILAQRAASRGAAGVVTDGCFRDSPGFASIDLPAYYRAPHAGTFRLAHFPLETNVPVTCGGVLVLPGDIVVGDAEGVVVIPAALAERVADAALEQELAEEFAFERVKQGESIVGLYPLSDERRPELAAWLAEHERTKEDE